LKARFKMKTTIALNRDAGSGRNSRRVKIYARLYDSDQRQLADRHDVLGRYDGE
jgi:hypothetical protein